MSLSPSENTVHARAYARIKEALMTGAYKPGQQLTVRALAEALGTSVMPVREALGRLAAEGAVEILPNRRARVPVLTQDRLREITEIRTRLESFAAAEAAMRMNEQQIAELDRLQIEMTGARNREDYRSYMAANEALHFAIYNAASMPSLLRLIEGMWLQCGPFINVLLPTMRGIDIHAEVIAAIRSRDCVGAGEAIVRDIERAAQHVEKLLSQEPRQVIDVSKTPVGSRRKD